MIASLRGRVVQLEDGAVVIDVSGGGYLVFCDGRTLGQITALGEDINLFIETHVREDHIHLYGFRTVVDREWFRILVSVQGVGAKVALSILSVLGPAQLATALAAHDNVPFTQASGVGSKLAQRIVSELKDKVSLLVEKLSPEIGAISMEGSLQESVSSMRADAISALVNLGYQRSDAYSAVASISKDEGMSVESFIKVSLKQLAQISE